MKAKRSRPRGIAIGRAGLPPPLQLSGAPLLDEQQRRRRRRRRAARADEQPEEPEEQDE